MSPSVTLPERWSIKTLGEVCSLVSGAGFPLEYQNQKGEECPFFKVANLAEVRAGESLRWSNHTISASDAKTLGAKIIPAGATVFAKIGMAIRLNRRRQVAQASCIDNNMMAAIPKSDIIDGRYLLRFLETVDLIQFVHTTTVPAVRKSDLERISVPVPPLAEQRLITVTVDSLLAACSDSADHLQAGQQAIQRFRQTILADAASGRLTSDWRDQGTDVASVARVDLQSAAKRSRKVASAIENFTSNELQEIPDSWRWVPLGAVSESVLGKMLDQAKNRGDFRPYLRNLNVRWRTFDLSDVLEMRFEADEDQRYGIHAGDVMVCEGGEPGRAAVWRESTSTMHFQKALHRVRCHDLLLPDWLMNVLQAHASSGLLTRYFTGTGIKHLTGISLARVPIPLPPVAEQLELVQIVDSLWLQADRVVERLNVFHPELGVPSHMA